MSKHVKKTSLTPDERLRAAWAHLCCGVDQHTVAAMYGVNAGRVAEAVTAVRSALNWPAKGSDQ